MQQEVPLMSESKKVWKYIQECIQSNQVDITSEIEQLRVEEARVEEQLDAAAIDDANSSNDEGLTEKLASELCEICEAIEALESELVNRKPEIVPVNSIEWLSALVRQ
jgi:hypothetical protein